MKIDIVSIVQLSLIVIFMMTVFTYAVHSCRQRINSLEKDIIDSIFLLRLNYFKELSVKDYMSFEKYGVWRYSVHF